MSISTLRSDFFKAVCVSFLTFVSSMTFAADASILRINVGGPGFTDNSGNPWKADYGYKSGYVSKTTNKIKKSKDARIYQSQRRHNNREKQVIYSIPLPNGKYAVTVHFAELQKSNFGKGKRVFDVYAEGGKKLSGIDIFKQSGAAYTAMSRSFSNLNVNDGKLDLLFKGIKQQAAISAIEIKSLNGKNIAGGSSSSSDSVSNTSTGNANLKITQQPANEIATPGTTVNLKIGAAGKGTIKYQWYFNGIKVSGATKNTLRFASVANSNAGNYYCMVSNGSNNLKSSTAKLIVSGVDPIKNSKSVSISWVAPTKRTNGKALKQSEIAEFEIYHGVGSASQMEHAETVDGANREHLFKGLGKGNHFFSIRTVDKQGARSNNSPTIKVLIQ